MVIDNLVSDMSLPMGPLELPLCETDEAGIWRLLESVCDPEIPVLSLREIGVLRAVKAAPAGWQLWITHTSNAVPNATNPIRLAGKMTRVQVACPQCESLDTTETSQFGSTACKALYKCLACAEPFDYFKPY